MKEKSRHNYLIKYVVVLAILLALTIIACMIPMGVDFIVPDDNLQSITSNVTNTVYNVNYPTSNKLGQFDNGTVYVYTDPTKVEDAHAGFIARDVTEITVDITYPHGSQKNPYVISTLADWETFVKQMTEGTNGSGEYYVLANDLDFDSVTFHGVKDFSGNFHGLGFALKNISITGAWQYWTGSSYANMPLSSYGYGVFCNTLNAVITDLIVQDYEFIDLPATYAFTNNRASCTGGIVGYSSGECNILNCHTMGYIGSPSLTYSIHTPWGGIIGEHYSTSSLTIYRCTATIEVYGKYTGAYVPVYGGIIGESYGASTSLSIFDSVASISAEVPSVMYTLLGSVCGILQFTQAIKIENVVGEGEIVTSAPPAGGAIGYITDFGSIKLSNVYVGATTGASTATKLPEYMAICGSGSGMYTASNSQLSNLYIYKPDALSYQTYLASQIYYSFIASSPAQPNLMETYADMYTQAQQDVGSGVMPSSIWNKSKIGNYTPADSPVRNFLTANVTFSNLLSDGNEDGLGLSTAEYRAGDALPTPSGSYLKTYHTFRGWTTDKTGKSKPYDTLPTGMFGDVTLYAVWGLTDTYINNYITTSLTLKDNISKIEYDSVNSITLKASVTHNGPSSGGMTNPRVTYSFLKDGEEKTTTDDVKSSGELSVKTVLDSGEYSFTYQIKDGLEPLWFYDGEYSDSEEIEIEKGKQASMTIKNFKLSTSTVPYYGMEVGLLEYTVSMYNKANKEVTLDELGWKLEQFTIVKGTNSGEGATIKVSPADQDNYEEFYEFEIEFESQALVIEFNMPRISDKLTVEVKYGQNYGAAEIIYLFQQEYMKALSRWSTAVLSIVESKEPYFDGKPIANGSADRFNTDFNDIQEKKTIEVTFETVTYMVTFDQDDGVSTPIQEAYSYGQYLRKPTPDPVKDGYILVGWYFDEITYDENGRETTTSRAWRFNSVGDIEQDRVTGEITLKAKWLKPTSVESVEITVASSKKFTALSKIQDGDITVTAIYSGELDGVRVSQPVVLNWSDYASGITYSSSDDILHVSEGKNAITVEFSGVTSEPATLNVVPVNISTAKLTFADMTVLYVEGDETPVTMIPVKGNLPAGIINVTYVYTKGGDIVDPSTVHGLGTWIVRAEFETDSADYAADAMLAYLRIVRPTTLEKPTFTDKVTYDGTEKNIEDYLVDFDEDYMTIVGSGAKATDAGTYTVTIQLVDGVSWADGTDDDITVTWKIDKATLIPDWDEWEFVLADAATGSGFAPVINNIASGIADADRANVDYATDFTYKIYDSDDVLLGVSEVSDTGTYKIVASINASSSLYKNYQFNGVSNEWYFVVVPENGMDILTIEWSDTEFVYDGEAYRPTYTVLDRDGNVVNDTNILSQLVFDNYEYKTEIATYTIKVSVKDSDKYFIRSGSTCKWKIVNVLGEEPPEEGSNNPSSGDESGNGSGSLDLGNIVQYWPLIVSVISIILIMLFLSKAASYNSARKKFNKKSEKLERVYAGLFTGTLFGMSMTIWAAIAFTLAGLAVVSFIIMLICKSKCSKAEEAYEESLDEYNRNKAEYDERKRDENMQMMFMRMMGAQGGDMQGAYAGGQPALGADEIRGIVSETMTAMLPGVQQMLPAQASANDELVQKLIDQNEKLMDKLAHQSDESGNNNSNNDEVIKRLVENQELMMKKIAEQPAQSTQSVERIVEKAVASSSVNDDAIMTLIEGQRIIMEKLANQQPAQPQVIEKEVVKEVPVEKIVEKEVKVEVPVEKIVEKEVIKEVPVEVEKIVEKEVPVEVIKEVPVEVIKEVKVEVPVKAEAKPKKETAPRLTLDEAYALLTKEQKKFFDGLKQYALDKYKCKEKKTTYFVTYGQTATNPLLKLMIKKDITVALLKMEDELMKDIRRDATGDGTKVKVKETEILVTDAQAFETAKKMVDLRYDQIERYADLLKEQRSLRR